MTDPDYIDPKRKTQEQFVNELSALNPNIEVLGQYINANEKIELNVKSVVIYGMADQLMS